MAQVTTSKSTVAEAPARPRRALGLWASMALVIGSMIGSGIFLLPASLAPFGGISIIGWLFTAAGALFLLLLLGLPAYVWMRKQQAGEDRVKRGGVSTDQPVALHVECA